MRKQEYIRDKKTVTFSEERMDEIMNKHLESAAKIA